MKQRYDDIDEYIADLKMEIAANEQCATHHYNLGLALLSKRDFVGAEEALLNAVRNSPHLAEAYVQLGGICLERGVIPPVWKSANLPGGDAYNKALIEKYLPRVKNL